MEWISVKDRMPEENDVVLFVYWHTADHKPYRRVGFYQNEDWYTIEIGKIDGIATHWMQLPSKDQLENPYLKETFETEGDGECT